VFSDLVSLVVCDYGPARIGFGIALVVEPSNCLLQHGLVVGQLLKETNLAARGDDGDLIPFVYSLVDKLRQGLSRSPELWVVRCTSSMKKKSPAPCLLFSCQTALAIPYRLDASSLSGCRPEHFRLDALKEIDSFEVYPQLLLQTVPAIVHPRDALLCRRPLNRSARARC